MKRLTAFVASVSPFIPWHVTAFHKDYRMSDPENTTPEMLMRAAAIAHDAGLQYVYAGNIPGAVGDLENTRCHQCSALPRSSATATWCARTASPRPARVPTAGR